MALYDDIMERTRWFREDRLGIFIHFGLYSIPARGEWVRSVERISIDDYRQYFDEFNPRGLDIDEWMDAAIRSGAKYVVLTAKHHDGFCLFDSSLTDYKSTNTPYGRDIIADYVDSARRHGLKVGIYYSLVDWHHPDYPAWGDRQHPHRDDPSFRDTEHDWGSYLAYMHGQVEELCSSYGKLDVLWFDFSYWDMKGEKWGATDLVRKVRFLQPEVIIDNRLGGDMFGTQPDEFAGDFAGPEQMIPRLPVRTEDGKPLPWETCITLNDSWGYNAADSNWKSAGFVIRSLVNCVSKGGNLLVNLGPDGNGRMPRKSLRIMDEVGEWMALNGDSVYGCGPAELPRPEWGYFTAKDNAVYAHVLEPVVGHFCLPGLDGLINKCRLLSNGSEIPFGPYWNSDAGAEIFGEPGDVYANFGLPLQRTFSLPDPRDSVIKIDTT